MVEKAFHGGAFFSFIGEDFSNLDNFKKVMNADVLDAWFEPSPKVMAKIVKYLPQILRTSPPMYSKGLIETISKYRGIPKENILALAGSSNVIYILFPNLLSEKDKVLTLDPTYTEYFHISENVVKVDIVRHLLDKKNNFNVDYGKLLDDFKKHNPKIIILVNPNSPTGQYWDKSEIKRFLDNIPPKTLVVIDETYIEYVNKAKSLEKEVSKYKNLIIIKSMSKVYALSGVRVGYLVANPEIISKIFKFVPPWAVSLVAQIAGVEALKDEEYYIQKYKETHKLREEMFADLNKIVSIKVYNTVANFLLIELRGKIKADYLVNRLKEKNIFIRNCDTTSTQFNNNFVRVSIKDRNTNKIILDELKKIIK